ncbi:MAG TPA: glycosyltransferase family 39 protein [Patescibacteria group bacterium]|nr:glycosyltransferase family 39 protein [Patescibacteria group bacterium]
MNTALIRHPKHILFGIICLATLLRVGLLGKIPVGLYIDEVAIGVDAVSVSQTGRDMHGNSALQAIYPSYGDYKLPVYILLSAVSVKMFGTNEFAVRFPSAVAGVGTVVAVYILAKDFFQRSKQKERIALCAAAFIAIMPWSILFSRSGFEGHVGQFFLLLSAVAAFRSHKSIWWCIITALFGAMAVYTYYSVRFVFPVVLVGVMSIQMTSLQWKALVGKFLLSIMLWMVLLIPMVRSPLYEASQRFRLSARSVLQDYDKQVGRANELRSEDQFSLASRVFHHRYLYLVKDLARNYAANMSLPFLFLTGDPNLRHGTGKVGLMLFPTLPIFLIGMYVIARRYKKEGFVLLMWYMVSLLPASVPYEIPHALRSLNALGVFGLVLGIGADACIHWCLSKKRMGYVLLVAGFCIIIVSLGMFMADYLLSYPSRSAMVWFDGNKQAASFLASKRGEGVSLAASGDEKMFLWYAFYAGISGKELQTIQSISYRKPYIGSVKFGTNALNDALRANENGYALGTSMELYDDVSESIYGASGIPVYGVKRISPKGAK